MVGAVAPLSRALANILLLACCYHEVSRDEPQAFFSSSRGENPVGFWNICISPLTALLRIGRIAKWGPETAVFQQVRRFGHDGS